MFGSETANIHLTFQVGLRHTWKNGASLDGDSKQEYEAMAENALKKAKDEQVEQIPPKQDEISNEIEELKDITNKHKQNFKFWTKEFVFGGRKVYQRDDLIDIALTDETGRTNLQRMEKGLAPLGPDGKSLNLHHTIQKDPGPVVEITETMHQQFSKELHINPNTTPSNVDRDVFNAWRKKYWKNRAKDFLSK